MKKYFWVHFYEIKVHVLKNWSRWLKNTKHLKFDIRQIFYASLKKWKKNHIFREFWKSSVAHVKIVVCFFPSEHGRQKPTELDLLYYEDIQVAPLKLHLTPMRYCGPTSSVSKIEDILFLSMCVRLRMCSWQYYYVVIFRKKHLHPTNGL